MSVLRISLDGGTNRSPSLSAENLVNMYAEKAPSDSRTPVLLLGAPGLKLFATAGAGPCRGLHEMAGVLYAVSGPILYSISASGSVTSIGAVPGSDLVDMSDNGAQMIIVTNPDAYVYDRSAGTLTQVTDPDFPGASSVDFLDGYFIFTQPRSGEFFISALEDGTSYDALDFATAESNPDNLVRAWVDHREILLFGQLTMEPWYDSGGADFPFDRIPQAITERGDRKSVV